MEQMEQSKKCPENMRVSSVPFLFLEMEQDFWNRAGVPRNCGKCLFQLFGTKWNNNLLNTSSFPRTQSIKRIERSEIAGCAHTCLQNALKAVLSHKKARRVDDTSSGLKRLKTQNTTSGKRKGDALKGIPKSMHKRELILDEEEFDASSFGGDEESRTPVRKPLTKAFYECSHLIKIPSAPRQMAGSALQ